MKPAALLALAITLTACGENEAEARREQNRRAAVEASIIARKVGELAEHYERMAESRRRYAGDPPQNESDEARALRLLREDEQDRERRDDFRREVEKIERDARGR